MLNQAWVGQRALVSHIDRRAAVEAGVITRTLLTIPGGQVTCRGRVEGKCKLRVEGIASHPRAAQSDFFLDGKSRQPFDMGRRMPQQLNNGYHAQPVVQRLANQAGSKLL